MKHASGGLGFTRSFEGLNINHFMYCMFLLHFLPMFFVGAAMLEPIPSGAGCRTCAGCGWQLGVKTIRNTRPFHGAFTSDV